jgi:hypothetical protein
MSGACQRTQTVALSSCARCSQASPSPVHDGLILDVMVSAPTAVSTGAVSTSVNATVSEDGQATATCSVTATAFCTTVSGAAYRDNTCALSDPATAPRAASRHLIYQFLLINSAARVWLASRMECATTHTTRHWPSHSYAASRQTPHAVWTWTNGQATHAQTALLLLTHS